jgi:hypothetical protein
VIRLWTNANHDIGSYISRKETRPRQLPQTAFYAVASNRRLAEPRNDQPDTSPRALWKYQRGSDDPNLEQRGSDTLPLLRDTL